MRPGRKGEDDHAQARQAGELTRAMIAKYQTPDHKEGAWDGLIYRYESDEISPVQDVKGRTHAGYRETNAYWSNAIGKSDIEVIKQIEAGHQVGEVLPPL